MASTSSRYGCGLGVSCRLKSIHYGGQDAHQDAHQNAHQDVCVASGAWILYRKKIKFDGIKDLAE
jgi:hypothetical protein